MSRGHAPAGEQIDEHDGKLKAFVKVDHEGAREAAKRAEKAVVDGDELGLLHGIPVSVKGHIFVKGWPSFDMGAGRNIRSAPRDPSHSIHRRQPRRARRSIVLHRRAFAPARWDSSW